MKQRDKKVIKRRKVGFGNTPVLEEEFYDELHSHILHKNKRTQEKSGTSLKKNLVLAKGRIVEVKSNYLNIVRIDDKEYPCSISGRLKQYLFKTKLLTAVGDWVEVDTTNAPDYRIEVLLPRNNTLSRFSENAFQKEIIVASNIDYLVITASWRMPLIKPGLIDRYICIAAINKLSPIVCINKMDLCDDRSEAEEIVSYYKKLDIPVIFTSVITNEGIQELKELLINKDSVFSGQSGTGKSSLINCLEPEVNLAVDEVSDYNEKGKHTTSQARLIKWSFGGNLVDTPGLKTINLHREQKCLIPSLFPGFSEFSPGCFFRSCAHDHEENCAVKDAMDKGLIPVERYESYLRIMESL
ncbi:MAG: ribosome small subunit-dependent GTPase A [Candidatus Cloacimonetes bacterium]|nr:ribosome small subunit-dependent GTPase A [Candidatus Cloacimonadota bacterium]